MSGRALVIGAGGFLGHHLVSRLVALEWDVVALLRDRSSPHLVARVESWPTGSVEVVEGDARDPKLLRQVVSGCTAVFPFAGQSGAALSVVKPKQDLSSNVEAQLSLLDALRSENPEARVVYPGSRLQYGAVEELPVPERHSTRPTSIYGLHKNLSEGYYRLYHELYGMPLTCLRITNPYGPRQDRPDHAFGIVGTFINAARAGQEIELWGGGSQLRDYLYIDDLIDLIIECVENDRAVGRCYNAGSGVATSLAELVRTILDLVGSGSAADKPWPSLELRVETGDFVADVSKVRDELGWRPKVSLREGLHRTITVER